MRKRCTAAKRQEWCALPITGRSINGSTSIMADADPTLSKPSDTALRRQLNAIKAEQFPWMLEVTKNAPQMAIIHLGTAVKNFFAGRTVEYPTFKQKDRQDSFTLTNDQFALKGREVHIPKLGWVRMHEAVRFTGRVVEDTVSCTADRWFLSVTV